MGKLTERGEIVNDGFATLADENGDDTLTRPAAAAESADAERTGEDERQDQDSPGPADIPAPPVIETADDQDAAGRENR